MKPRLIVLFFSILIGISLNAQVFSSAKVLSPGNFSFGMAPAYYNNSLGLFFFAEVGVISGLDFELKYGVVEYDDYFGADLEWKIYSDAPVDFSLTTGAHVYGDAGLDIAPNISFRIKNDVAFYTGLDADLNFGDDLYMPLWLPVGVKINLNKTVSFLFEGELPLTHPAYAIIDGGFRVHF